MENVHDHFIMCIDAAFSLLRMEKEPLDAWYFIKALLSIQGHVKVVYYH